MKVISSHQHDALARQCAEAIRIKEIEPQKRINNKEEYHQPGEVEIRYEKNETIKMINKSTNSNKQNNNETDEPQNKNDQQEIKNQKTITHFFRMMDSHINRNFNNENDQDIITSQNMIEDARARRSNKNKSFNCGQCDYKTKSKTLLKKHQVTVHEQNESKNINYKT